MIRIATIEYLILELIIVQGIPIRRECVSKMAGIAG